MSHLPAEAAPDPLILISGADVRIDGQPVLRDIDWRLRPGERRGIVGANGSGKSTLLRLAGGTLWPAPGKGIRRYNFGDGVRTDAVEARTRIVDVGPELQNRYVRFGWNFRCIDVVRSGLTRTDIPRRNPAPAQIAEANAIMQRLGLDTLAGRRFLELSRGQQRRVLIARAVAFGPAVLLLDEPASGLDSIARHELNDLLESIPSTTAIVVTAHSPADLPSVLDRYSPLAGGRLGRELVHNASGTAAHRIDAASLPNASTTAGSGPLIAITNASVWLDERPILRDVNWRLEKGEHWLVTGRNGSGKSTFLRLLHGQLRPAVGGTITWPGLGNPRNVWDLRRQIGLVSAELQASYRYRATAAECIGSGFDSSTGLTRQLTAQESQRVDELLAAFDLVRLEQRLLTSLSYGQLHRVLIARTLVNRPRVLLLDEPWEGLDPATRGLVARQLKLAMDQGTQIVCASHVAEPGLVLNRHLRITEGRVRRDDAAA